MGHVSSIINLSSLNAQRQDEASAEGWEPDSKVVRQILAMRRARAKFFEPDLFAEPAWDILLELYSADLRGSKISVSRACIGSNVPYTTALRCIRRLHDKGLI